MPNDRDEVARTRAAGDLSGTIIGRYKIEARLGAGGMGEVYRALDTVLRREVALKRLHPGSAPDVENRRHLLREARAACALEHRAIAGVYDVLESESEAFIVEELVRGVPLDSRTGRPFELDEFFTVALDCCDALEAAAAKEIVHCDIKPANIFLTKEGLPRILDFGLARHLAADPHVTTASLEPRWGGTPGYVAPEVVRGEAPTPATDLFSLGVVFYEMLAGVHPFRRNTAAATIASTLQDVPPPPSTHNPAVPRQLDRLVGRMLEKDPTRRTSRPEEVRRELEAARGALPSLARRPPGRRRTAAVGFAALVALAAVAFAIRASRSHHERFDLPGGLLLVEGFESQGIEGSTDSFAEGLTEAVQIRLSRLPGVNVVDSSSDLGAAVKLGGSVQRQQDRLRIRYRLVDAKRGVLVAGDVVEGTVADIFELEDRVARGVSDALAKRYGLERLGPQAERTTTDVTAYDLYLQARGYLHRYESESNVEIAAGLFERALARDPHFALALAGLGEADWRRYEATKDTAWAHEAERVSQAALAQGSDLAEAHVTLGTVYVGTGRSEQAAREFRDALAIDSKSDAAYRGLAKAEEALGDPAAAEETFFQACNARPEYWAGYNDLGVFLFRHGRYDQALGAFRQVVALTPDNARGYSNLGAVYQSLGRDDEAIDAYERSLALQPNHRAYSNLATLYRAHGKYEQAAEDYKKALALSGNDYRIWGSLAGTFRLIPGMDAQADSALERALALAKGQLQVNPEDGLLTAMIAQYHADLGHRAEARREGERAVRLGSDDAEVLAQAAAAFEILGDRSRALEIVARAVSKGYPPEMLRSDPSFKALVADTRFEQLVNPIVESKQPESGDGTAGD